jgi:hypothetical protein
MKPVLRGALWIAAVIAAGTLGFAMGFREGVNSMGDGVVAEFASYDLERQVKTVNQVLTVLHEESADQARERSEAMLFDALGEIELKSTEGHHLECDAWKKQVMAAARAYLAAHPEIAGQARHWGADKGAKHCP